MIVVFMLYQLPAVRYRLDWRIDIAWTYLRGVFNPAKPLPTPLATMGVVFPSKAVPTSTHDPGYTLTPQFQGSPPALTVSPQATSLPMATSSPMPQQMILPAPTFELQDWNNCGPATLAMNMHFYSWQGSQYDIADLIKSLRNDRNVNPEELVAYVHSQTNLHAMVRVDGDIDLLRRLLAGGFPVMIEETFIFAENFWLNDDRWAAHYLLLTGYNDATRSFTVQNSFVGANQFISYDDLEKNWRPFNNVYMLVYPPDLGPALETLLGGDADMDLNRTHALERARSEVSSDPQNAFSWFNEGSNLVYFEDYTQAATAYDTARQLGLPQRMLRYQFGPFHAYFQSGRIDDLLALTEYALDRTPNSEEALLWYGWAQYRSGKYDAAQQAFHDALKAHPGYTDAEYALSYVLEH